VLLKWIDYKEATDKDENPNSEIPLDSEVHGNFPPHILFF
jgi:hypothetical protein